MFVCVCVCVCVFVMVMVILVTLLCESTVKTFILKETETGL